MFNCFIYIFNCLFLYCQDKEVKDKPLLQYCEAGSLQPVAIFDCRGAEPVKWYPIGLSVETAFGRFEMLGGRRFTKS